MHGFDKRGADASRGEHADNGRFGRMFPELASLKSFSPGPKVLGSRGTGATLGLMEGPSGDNDRIKAGYTFLGQFIDHDLTLDHASILEKQIDLGKTTNFRTPVFELDSLYGRGPAADPALYDKTKPGMFLVALDGTDLPRNEQGVAIIADHRNDENRVIAQLHVLFLKFHNKVLADIAASGTISDAAVRFEAAQKTVRWHYQWIILNDFLPRTVGQEMVDSVLANTDRNQVGPAFMPVEFSGAAYRFGHSQIRPQYPTLGGGTSIFPGLVGGSKLPAGLRVVWPNFFGSTAEPSRLIDTQITSAMLSLPNSSLPPDTPLEFRSLAVRNLIRGQDLALPAGQTIAEHLGIPPLADDVLWKGIPGGSGLAPLWFYVLREAEALHQGNHLGGVGAFIVTKTFINLLLADEASVLSQNPDWTPELPSEQPGTFTMADLVNYTLGLSGPDALKNETISFASVAAASTPQSNIAAQPARAGK
jgi:hypothetical protein